MKEIRTKKIQGKILSNEEKEQMMLDAIKLSEWEWMKKYPIGDHGDYLNRAKNKYNIEI